MSKANVMTKVTAKVASKATSKPAARTAPIKSSASARRVAVSTGKSAAGASKPARKPAKKGSTNVAAKVITQIGSGSNKAGGKPATGRALGAGAARSAPAAQALPKSPAKAPSRSTAKAPPAPAAKGALPSSSKAGSSAAARATAKPASPKAAPTKNAPAAATSTKNIVETAVAAGSFKTLVAAVQAAGLAETLSGGNFTVFAPTDEAFAKLPAGTLEMLLKPENTAKLAAILPYHVVPGTVKAADVVKLTNAGTVQGQRVDILAKDGTVTVDGAKVVKTDIACSNGVIHVIDTVILPVDKNIVEVAASNGSFNTLVAAVKAAGLVETLSGKGPFTVLAPTDAAFATMVADGNVVRRRSFRGGSIGPKPEVGIDLTNAKS